MARRSHKTCFLKMNTIAVTLTNLMVWYVSSLTFRFLVLTLINVGEDSDDDLPLLRREDRDGPILKMQFLSKGRPP